MLPRCLLYCVIGSLILVASAADADWIENGVATSTAVGFQAGAVATTDGNGGAIIAWRDDRDGGFFESDIYVQRVDVNGVPQWTHNGVAVVTAVGQQADPVIVSDGAGGAIIAWEDVRGADFDIYAQRVDALGTPLWMNNGVPISTAPDRQCDPQIVSDMAGGAIIVWEDDRNGFTDIFARRVDALGVPQWIADGSPVSVAADFQRYPVVVSDGASGAVIAWTDERFGNSDILAQRMDSSGNPLFTIDGTAICLQLDEQKFPAIAADLTGGAIIAWQDDRDVDTDIYAQRVSGAGTKVWTTDGVAYCTETFNQSSARIVADGAGGVIIAWSDLRFSPITSVYAQRVDSWSSPLWDENGSIVSASASNSYVTGIVAHGTGGAIATMRDTRAGSSDIYAQRLNASGIAEWEAGGKPVCTASGSQISSVIIADGVGGVIVAWDDPRSGNSDIYVQRLEEKYGFYGHQEPELSSVTDIPNDQGSEVAVDWTASGWDVYNRGTITHYSVWRATNGTVASSLGTLVDAGGIPPEFTGAVHRLAASGDFFWEFIASLPATYLPSYTYTAPTRFDSTASDPALHYFEVIAHTVNQFVFWRSSVDSGYSVDNLAPAAPAGPSAQRIEGGVQLVWSPSGLNEPDFLEFAIYRDTQSSVVVDPNFLLSTSADTTFLDSTALESEGYYYIITAFDTHGNESMPTSEISVGPATAIGPKPPRFAPLTMLPNSPNPFATATSIRFGLRAASDVTIDVYDIAGRRVRSIHIAQVPAGWQNVAFDAIDDAGVALASGVYVYRVTAGGVAVSQKFTVVR